MLSSMQGKICLITGATAGIGEITAREMARLGATVVGVGRDAQKSAAVAAHIRAETGNDRVEYLLADLSSQAAVRRLAETFKGQYARLDVLINNAGAFYGRRQESVDGVELTFALNHLSYFLLTTLLLDVLKASAPARIVNVSSEAHAGTSMNFDDLEGKTRFSGWRAYAQSKLANVLLTYELARRLEGSGVTANALHPGFVATNFALNNFTFPGARLAIGFYRLFLKLASIPPEEGAQTSLYLATSPEVEGVTGKYFVKCRAAPSSPASHDPTAARRLWEISEQMVRRCA
jgi:NAD(P)-dependent dehydrogenase (short-subunit alcohol dehydrogenase family)